MNMYDKDGDGTIDYYEFVKQVHERLMSCCLRACVCTVIGASRGLSLRGRWEGREGFLDEA